METPTPGRARRKSTPPHATELSGLARRQPAALEQLGRQQNLRLTLELVSREARLEQHRVVVGDGQASSHRDRDFNTGSRLPPGTSTTVGRVGHADNEHSHDRRPSRAGHTLPRSAPGQNPTAASSRIAPRYGNVALISECPILGLAPGDEIVSQPRHFGGLHRLPRAYRDSRDVWSVRVWDGWIRLGSSRARLSQHNPPAPPTGQGEFFASTAPIDVTPTPFVANYYFFDDDSCTSPLNNSDPTEAGLP